MLSAVLQQIWPRPTPRAHALPDGVRVYAVGDIHGRLDKLVAMEKAITTHLDAVPPPPDCRVIFLGDYIDRGPDSRAVVERLLAPDFAGLPRRCLLGNHEAAMLGFLDDPAIGPAWLTYGAVTTLASYGVSMPAGPIENRMERLRRDLRAKLPAPHVDFLQGLELWAEIGDYLFVHAGVRPGRRLEQQSRIDLVEIREPFLSHSRPLPWRVVHGHTVSAAPEIKAHRIGIDTGAYAGGPLTCAVLEGSVATIISS